jgi:Mn-dependent DtxR family transcriptional regulator
MNIYESAEDYLETILILSTVSSDVRSIDIATEMGFSKPSVSRAMKNLRENGYILMDEKGLITLTESGKEIAERIYERHQFFTDALIAIGVDPDIAVRDACRIEHDLSIESFEKIKEHVLKMKELRK